MKVTRRSIVEKPIENSRIIAQAVFMESNHSIPWAVLFALLLLLFVLNLTFGSVDIPFREIVEILTRHDHGNNTIHADILWNFRITKALTCVLAGSALAVGGLQMQTLFRNALAGPDVLGLSSGASLMVSLLILNQAAGVALLSDPGPWALVIASSIGAGGVFLIVLVIARRLTDNTSLLIIGLMIGAATASLVSVLQFLSKAEDQQAYLLWTFGSLGSLNWLELQVLAGVLVIGVGLAVTSVKSLNAWLLGDNYTRSLGININRSRILIILSTALLTGGVTAFCGPIGFVGLAVPHLTKLGIKTHNHKILLPAVMICGAALMLFCDILAQLPGSAHVLPINAITALIGAPVIIWILLRSKRVSI